MKQFTSILNPHVKLETVDQLKFLFEQYKLFVDTSSKSTDHRRNLNTFYITVNTIIMSALSALADGGYLQKKNLLLLGIFMLVGIASTLSWISAIHVYKTMNNKYFAVTAEFERYLPAQVFTSINKDLSRLDPYSEGKNFVTQREIIVPYAFLAGYVIYSVFNIVHVVMN